MKARVKRVTNCGLVRWVADLRCFDAGRKFFETEDEALTHWEAKAKEVRNHGVSALSFSHEDRIQFLLAKEKLSPVGAKVMEAVEHDFVRTLEGTRRGGGRGSHKTLLYERTTDLFRAVSYARAQPMTGTRMALAVPGA